MYPIDLPVVGDTDLTLASEQYFYFLESIPHKPEEFQSSTTTKVSPATFYDQFATLVTRMILLIVGYDLFPQTTITVNTLKRCFLKMVELTAHCWCFTPLMTQHKVLNQTCDPCQDIWKTSTQVLCFIIQFWLYTCMTRGGVWMMYYEQQSNPGVVCYW